MSCTSFGCGSKVASRLLGVCPVVVASIIIVTMIIIGLARPAVEVGRRRKEAGAWITPTPAEVRRKRGAYRPAPRSRRSFLSDVDLAEEASPMVPMSSPRSSSPRSMTPSPVRSMSSPYLSDVEGDSPMRSMSSPARFSHAVNVLSPIGFAHALDDPHAANVLAPLDDVGSEEEAYGSAEEEEYPMRRSQMPSSSSGEWVLPFDQPRREEGVGRVSSCRSAAPQLLAAPQQLEQFG